MSGKLSNGITYDNPGIQCYTSEANSNFKVIYKILQTPEPKKQRQIDLRLLNHNDTFMKSSENLFLIFWLLRQPLDPKANFVHFNHVDENCN